MQNHIMRSHLAALLCSLFLGHCIAEKTTQPASQSKQDDQVIKVVEEEAENPTISRIELITEDTVFFIGSDAVLEINITYDDDSTATTDSEIIWNSSDENIATIDDGTLTPLSPGTTDITVSSDDFEDSLTIEVLPGEIAFTTWVGTEHSTLIMDTVEGNYAFKVYWSSSSDCAPAACEDAQSSALEANQPVALEKHNQSTQQYFQLKLADTLSQIATYKASKLFPERNFFQVNTLTNDLIVVGGKSADNTQYFTDSWLSSDAATWSPVGTDQAFGNRENHRLALLKDNLYMTGGWNGTDKLYNDVWRSIDGKSWELVNDNAAFPARDSHQLTAFNDSLIITGGWTKENGCHSFNDVWSSTDGSTWEKLNESAAFSKRCAHQTTVFNDKMLMTAGLEGHNESRRYLNDVWESADGKSWSKLTDSAAFPARFKHQVVSFKNALYLIGGFNGNNQATYFNDVWHSTNGKDWTQLTEKAPFEARADHQVVATADYLYVLSGKDESTHYHDIWRSKDGKVWEKRVRGVFTFK